MGKTYEAMTRNSKSDSSGGPISSLLTDWHFTDLKNAKQMSDLEKRMTSFRIKNEMKVFNFASSRHQEGVSTIVVNLAKYMAIRKKNKKILIIDANLQNPVLHKAFNLSSKTGLSEMLSGSATSLPEVVQQMESTSIIDLLATGRAHEHTGEGIEQDKFHDIISAAKDRYDYIIIDSAPILTSSDSLSSAISSDVTFLVIRSVQVQKEVAEKAKQLLQENDCQIGGAILNRVLQVIPSWLYRKF